MNLPPPVSPGGPPLWLGGQGPRGRAIAAREADGWVVPSLPFVDPATFAERREHIQRELETAGRDVSTFRFGAQVPSGPDDDSLVRARQLGLAYAAAGATDLVLALPAGLGPDGLRRLEQRVALPLRDALD